MALTTVSLDDVKALASKHEELEHLLLAAPESIAKLAQLMLVATCAEDFPVKEPVGGFKHVQHPTSFCANLLEVVHAGYNALNTAEDNIQEISMHTRRVPDYVADVFNALLLEEPENVTKRLHFTLSRIRVVATACADLIAKVDAKFEHALNYTSELAESSTATKKEEEGKSEQAEVKPGTLDLQKLDTPTIHQTLIDGIKTLAAVRSQWQSLGGFFREFSNLVTLEMQDTLQNFAKYSETAGKRKEISSNDPSAVALKMLFEKAMKLNKVSFQIVTLAGTYLEVSNDHLVPTSRNLGVLLALNAKTEMPLIQQKQHEVNLDCENAKKQIEARAQANKETTLTEFKGLMDQMNEYVTQGRAAKII